MQSGAPLCARMASTMATTMVLDSIEQANIAECKNCRIVVGPTSGSVFLIDCVDCVGCVGGVGQGDGRERATSGAA